MVGYKFLGESKVYGMPTEGRAGRMAVELDDGRTLEADYWATGHRLEIRIGDKRIVRGATSWCNAIRWGLEYKSGQEALRVALEIERWRK